MRALAKLPRRTTSRFWRWFFSWKTERWHIQPSLSGCLCRAGLAARMSEQGPTFVPRAAPCPGRLAPTQSSHLGSVLGAVCTRLPARPLFGSGRRPWLFSAGALHAHHFPTVVGVLGTPSLLCPPHHPCRTTLLLRIWSFSKSSWGASTMSGACQKPHVCSGQGHQPLSFVPPLGLSGAFAALSAFTLNHFAHLASGRPSACSFRPLLPVPPLPSVCVPQPISKSPQPHGHDPVGPLLSLPPVPASLVQTGMWWWPVGPIPASASLPLVCTLPGSCSGSLGQGEGGQTTGLGPARRGVCSLSSRASRGSQDCVDMRLDVLAVLSS